MTPFYEADGITLYNADFRDVIASREIGADCIIADPPYGETSLAWDRWPERWPTEARKALHPDRGGSMWCFGSARMFLEHAREFREEWNFAQDIVWEKHNGSGFHADRFRRVHEHAYHWYPENWPWADVYKNPVTTPDATARTVRRKGRPAHTGHINGSRYTSEDGGPRLMRSVIYVRSEHGTAENETQKPEGIVRPLIEYACPPGGLVFSPFAGSGTDLVVARSLGRRAIGCELRNEQCEVIARRLSQRVLPLQGVA